MRLNHKVLLVLSLLFGACDTYITRAPSQLVVPLEYMNLIINSKSVIEFGKRESRKTEFPLIWVHFDSEELCGTCILRQYYLWDDILNQVNFGDILNVFFILEADNQWTLVELQDALNEYYFSQPVYVDFNHEFKHRNGIEVKGSMDYLIDSMGNVIMMGDIRNDERFIRKMKAAVERWPFNH